MYLERQMVLSATLVQQTFDLTVPVDNPDILELILILLKQRNDEIDWTKVLVKLFRLALLTGLGVGWGVVVELVWAVEMFALGQQIICV